MTTAIFVHIQESDYMRRMCAMGTDRRSHEVRLNDVTYILYSHLMHYRTDGIENCVRPQHQTVGAYDEITLYNRDHYLFHPSITADAQNAMLANMLALVIYVQATNTGVEGIDGFMHLMVRLTTATGDIAGYPVVINTKTGSSRDFTYVGRAPENVHWVNRGRLSAGAQLQLIASFISLTRVTRFRTLDRHRELDAFARVLKLANFQQRVDQVYAARRAVADQ